MRFVSSVVTPKNRFGHGAGGHEPSDSGAGARFLGIKMIEAAPDDFADRPPRETQAGVPPRQPTEKHHQAVSPVPAAVGRFQPHRS